MPKMVTILARSLFASALSFSTHARASAEKAFTVARMVPACATVCRPAWW